MRSSKTLPVTLAIIISALILAGVLYGKIAQKQKSDLEVAMGETPSAAASPAAEAAAPAPGASVDPAVAAAPASNAAPDLTMDANGLSKSTVVITTNKGVIKFKFYPKDAPNTVNRIIELVQKGFYNGLSFHRVVANFVIQGGDPKGDGTGGSGQNLKAEFNGRRHVEGTVAMARANDPDSADSQFYISLTTNPHLDHKYTVFGQVIEGMDIVRKIEIGDKMTSVALQ